MVSFNYLKVGIVLIFVFYSCLNKYKGFDIDENTQVVLPIGHGSFVLGEVLDNFNKDSLFQTGKDSDLIITYKEIGIERILIDQLVTFHAAVDLAGGSKALDRIALGDTSYQKHISLDELTGKIKDNVPLPEFTDGEKTIFPAINPNAQVAALLKWKIADLDYIHEVTFANGKIECSLTNNFPTNSKTKILLQDSVGNTIDLISFFGESGNGLLPGETQIISKSLEGISIKPPLYFTISELHLSQSDEMVTIDLDKGFNFNFSLVNMKISEGTIRSDYLKYASMVQRMNVNFGNSAEIKRVLIQSGDLNVHLQKEFDLTGVLSVYFPHLKKDGVPYTISVPVTDNSPVSQSISLNDVELGLYSETGEFNTLEYSFGFKSTSSKFVDIKSTDAFQYSFDLQKMVLSYVEGYFGNITVDVSKKNFTLNPEIWKKYQGEVLGSNSKLTLYFENPFGVPIKSSIDVVAFNQDGDSVSINYPDFFIPYPKHLEEGTINSEINFTDANANIDDLINLPPNGPLNLLASIELNPNGKPLDNTLNFVDPRDTFVISLGITIPVLIKGSFFNYIDTFRIANLDILKHVKKAELLFRTKNRVPLQVNLSVLPYDTISGSGLGDDLFVTILDAAKTDELGSVTEPTEANNSLTIEGDNLNNLMKCNSIIVKAAFLSPGEGSKPAKIKNDQGFDLNLILNVSPDF